MNDIDLQLLEDYFDGILGPTQNIEVESRLQNDSELRKVFNQIKLAKSIVQADEELEIRNMMDEVEENNLPPKRQTSTFNKKWIIAAIIGGLLVILASIFIRLTKIDKEMIAQDLIVKEKSQVVRSNDVEIDTLIEFGYIQPMKQINILIAEKKFDQALKNLEEIKADFPIAKENMQYTKGLILYLKNGRNDPEFHKILNEILDNPLHNCYNLAVRLDNKVNSIWGRIKN